MPSNFSLPAQKILGNSLAFARDFGHTYIGSEHILLSALFEKELPCVKLLIGAGADAEKTRTLIYEEVGVGERSADCVKSITENARKIIEDSALFAERDGRSEIGAEYILLALLKRQDSVALKLLSLEGCKINDVIKEIEHKNNYESTENSHQSPKKAKRGEERLPGLQRFSRNMTADALEKGFDPLIGRQSETERIMRILLRRTKNNPCLIGEPGVGKTAIVEGLARKISEGSVPSELRDAQIFSVDLPSMLAGAKYRGDFEERMKLIIDEASRNPWVILFIDEFHTIIGAGSAEGAIDAANIIKPALARGKIKLIGATTLDEYRNHIEKDPAFERRFQSVTVNEPSESESLDILLGIKEIYERHHNIKISEGAVRAAIRLSSAYINDRFLPDKAIDLIDESAARLKIESLCSENLVKNSETVLRLATSEKILSRSLLKSKESRSECLTENCVREQKNVPEQFVPTLREEDIARTLTEWTGIPINRVKGGENELFITLEDLLKERVIGQDHAVNRLVSAIIRNKAGLRPESRPIGSFIFTGPTGVGKTELAKALAETLYSGRDAFIRFDMSEYSEPHSVSRLIGAPPGYVGYAEGGQLSEKVRRNPYCVILFDEIEKAHRDVFSLLLQIMDEGTVKDSHGKSINFRSSVIIMTANIISDSSRSLGFLQSADNGENIRKKLGEIFPSEFLSRPDEIIEFSALSYPSILKITEKALAALAERLRQSEEIKLIFSDDVAEFIARSAEKDGCAREIRRKIAEKIESPLSVFLLSEKITNQEKIYVYLKNQNIIFGKEINSDS